MLDDNPACLVKGLYNFLRQRAFGAVQAVLFQLRGAACSQNYTIFWSEYRMMLAPAKGNLREA